MPYVKPEVRQQLLRRHPSSPGELTYKLTIACRDYLRAMGTRYDTLNTILGALEATKLELYRTVIAPYEDIKMKENGDVF